LCGKVARYFRALPETRRNVPDLPQNPRSEPVSLGEMKSSVLRKWVCIFADKTLSQTFIARQYLLFSLLFSLDTDVHSLGAK
jgi:hypothetical protein